MWPQMIPTAAFVAARLQAGVVSWGSVSGCGLTNLFGVYVRLLRYLDWIAANAR